MDGFFWNSEGKNWGGKGAGSLNWRCEGMDGFLYYWNWEGKQESPQGTDVCIPQKW